MAKIIKIEDLTIEDKFVTIEGTVIQLWTPTSKKIHQTGLIKDETGIMKFTTWVSNELPDVEENKSYAFIGFKVNEWDGRLNIQSVKFSKIKAILEDHQTVLEI